MKKKRGEDKSKISLTHSHITVKCMYSNRYKILTLKFSFKSKTSIFRPHFFQELAVVGIDGQPHQRRTPPRHCFSPLQNPETRIR